MRDMKHRVHGNVQVYTLTISCIITSMICQMWFPLPFNLLALVVKIQAIRHLYSHWIYCTSQWAVHRDCAFLECS